MPKAACLTIIPAYVMEEETVYGKRKRSIWTKEWLKRRSVFGHGNLIKDVVQQLANMSTHASNCCTTWLLRNKIQTCLKIVKLLHSQTTPHTMKQFAQHPVLRKLFDRVWGPLDNVVWTHRIGSQKKRDYACDGLRDAATCVVSHRKAARRGGRYRHVNYQIRLKRTSETSESAENH
jgi:hypothetical protein